MMSTRESTPQCSGVPRPCSPIKPTACESSTINEGAVTVGQIADAGEIGNDAVHRKHTVRGDQLEARAGGVGFFQLRFEVGEIVVPVAKALGLREPHTVDDAGVVQFVADDGVGFVEQRFEQTAVRIETARIQNAVVGLQECGERLLQFLVHGLRAANEAHRGHAEAVAIESVFGRGDQARVVSEAQIVVGAEVQDLRAVRKLHVSRLRARNHALGLVEAVGADLLERAAQMSEVGFTHTSVS